MVVMVVQPCECVKTFWAANFKWVEVYPYVIYILVKISYVLKWKLKEIRKKWSKVESQKVTKSASLDKMVRKGTGGTLIFSHLPSVPVMYHWVHFGSAQSSPLDAHITLILSPSSFLPVVDLPCVNKYYQDNQAIQPGQGVMGWILSPLKFMCWSPKFHFFRMCLYLEFGPFERWLS